MIASVARSVDGFASTGIPTVVWTVGGIVVTLIIDFAIVYLLLGVLGGIRPEHRARIVGATVGAIVITVLKSLLAVIIAWSISKPEYGAFAAPIAVLLILYLLTVALYASASIAAGVADRDAALESLTPTDPDRDDDS